VTPLAAVAAPHKRADVEEARAAEPHDELGGAPPESAPGRNRAHDRIAQNDVSLPDGLPGSGSGDQQLRPPEVNVWGPAVPSTIEAYLYR
jgi:hypothetical protein